MRLWEIGIQLLRWPGASLSDLDRVMAEVFTAPFKESLEAPSAAFVGFFPGHGPVLSVVPDERLA
jgi:hypothetical protein